MYIAKIISGGQTGADRGGLEAAIHCSLPHSGWCPKGRKAENGRIPDKYILTEMTTSDYLARTKANVIDSDATLIFTYDKMSGGSMKTMEFCKKYKKPVLHISINNYNRQEIVDLVAKWFNGNVSKPAPPDNCVLNIAGTRESKAFGIEQMVMVLMVDIISVVNGKLFYPLGLNDDIEKWIIR